MNVIMEVIWNEWIILLDWIVDFVGFLYGLNCLVIFRVCYLEGEVIILDYDYLLDKIELIVNEILEDFLY